jgi:hypothetical protein
MNIDDIDDIDETSEQIPELKESGKHLKAWKVFLDYALIDTVYYADDMDEKQVRRALIAVDGYPREITVEAE